MSSHGLRLSSKAEDGKHDRMPGKHLGSRLANVYDAVAGMFVAFVIRKHMNLTRYDRSCHVPVRLSWGGTASRSRPTAADEALLHLHAGSCP